MVGVGCSPGLGPLPGVVVGLELAQMEPVLGLVVVDVGLVVVEVVVVLVGVVLGDLEAASIRHLVMELARMLIHCCCCLRKLRLR